MAKSKRKAQNKIAGAGGDLVKVDPRYESEAGIHRASPIAVVKSTLFNAELEQVIDIIARERVYRAMLARMGRRMLTAPTSDSDAASA